MRKAISFAMTLIMVLTMAFCAQAQAPQSGVYRIQNVATSKYVKVTGPYAAAPSEAAQTTASDIKVSIAGKNANDSYKLNGLASTYTQNGQTKDVEVYDYIGKALIIGESLLRETLSSSDPDNVQTALDEMHKFVRENAYMSIKPVDGKANTYYAIAIVPTIPAKIEAEWAKKFPGYSSEYGTDMWAWCVEQVYNYLQDHSGPGGTDAGLAAKIRANLKKIHPGYTYLLTGDADGTFGYVEAFSDLTGPANAEWKLVPKANTDNMNDGTYKVRNIHTGKYVKIHGKYYAKPDAESDDDASELRLTIDGKNEDGSDRVTNVGATFNGEDIEIYSYIEKAILLGKTAIYNVLTQGDGVNPASQDNILIAQNFMENFILENAFMSMKGVDGKDAVYAYAHIPELPSKVVNAMVGHITGVNNADDCWQYGVNYVKQYLTGGTDNTLKSYILANIDNIKPGVTYYLGAEQNDTFDYYPKGSGNGLEADFNAIKDNDWYQWGFDVEEIEPENLTSGTYKVRNVETGDYVKVTGPYYARPFETEDNASEIHVTYAGKLDDGSYKVTNLSSTYTDDNGKVRTVDILSYINKAILLGKGAIATVLKEMSEQEDIEYAQDYMEKFVRENAYMRIKPVTGTNYVYAYATIPEIPYDVYHEMYRHGVITEDTKEAAWEYGVSYVENYLKSHGTNSTLAAYVLNNIRKVEQGHTYYLSEDTDQTFGYVDAEDFSTTNTRLQWGIDLQQEDQPVESDFYKIHNVGQDKYVHVEGMYYAKVNVDEDNATPIQVTVGEQMSDGSYKVTNLVGDGHDVQQYIQHAIELGEGVIDKVLAGRSTPEHIQKAKDRMREFIEANAFMQIRQVPGEENAYYAYATAPVIPDDIVNEWRKKYPSFNGTMWQWCVTKVKEYLTEHSGQGGTNSTLIALVRANIDNIKEGHTYYLSAESNGTFGYEDATTVDLQNTNFWWGFADAVKAEPVNGYFRIKNAGQDGKYVLVTGPFSAAPTASLDEAKTAAGTVIYLGTGETKNTKTLPISKLRSQGVDVGDYMLLINDMLGIIADAGVKVVNDKIAENPNYSQYAGLVEPLVKTLVGTLDLNLYTAPVITTTGKQAYTLEVNIPDLAEYCDLANTALSAIGKDKTALVNKLKAMEAEATQNGNSMMAKLYNIAWRTAQYLDAPDEMWAKLKENAIPYVQSYFIDGNGNTGGVGLQPAIGQLLLNALQRPDFNYGTTYCLRQDADGTFGYDSKDELANVDAGKWLLEPFDTEDPNYDAGAHQPFYLKADMAQATITDVDGEGVTNVGDTYYFTTAYLDFDAKIENQNGEVDVYTISATRKATSQVNAVGDKPAHTNVYYIAILSKVEGNVIPAQTPVVVRTRLAPKEAEAELNVTLRPSGEPTKPAVETASLSQLKEMLKELLYSKLGIQDATTMGIRPKVISEQTEGNLLVGSFFGEDVKSEDSNNYLALANKKLVQDELEVGLDMNGLGFWKDNVQRLEGNNAYLLGYNRETESIVDENFTTDTSFDEGNPSNPPGFIFEYPDGTFTRIDNVNASKEVKMVRYYNTLGVESTTPFDGVNIIVTTFTDGTRAVVKAIK